MGKSQAPLATLFLKAEGYARQLQQGLVKSRAELARREGLSKARITQILNLLKLAPEIKDYFKNTPNESVPEFFTERRLRKIATLKNWEAQLKEFQRLRRSVADQKVF